mgnify:CR=1 FL=1
MLSDAVDRTLKKINAEFFDEDGNSTVPITLTWSLLDGLGNIVNSRSAVVITPSASVDVCLGGDDIIYTDNIALNKRRILFEGTYNSTCGVKEIRKSEYFIVVKA